MKYFNKKMAAREGFTLVELIVVIAILAILAGIAYPAYTGYINRAKDAAAIENLSVVSTAAQGIAAGAGTSVTKIVVAAKGETVTVSYEDGKDTDATRISDLNLLVMGATGTAVKVDVGEGSYKGGANWTPAGGWKPGTT